MCIGCGDFEAQACGQDFLGLQDTRRLNAGTAGSATQSMFVATVLALVVCQLKELTHCMAKAGMTNRLFLRSCDSQTEAALGS